MSRPKIDICRGCGMEFSSSNQFAELCRRCDPDRRLATAKRLEEGEGWADAEEEPIESESVVEDDDD